MVNQAMYNYGSEPSAIRELFAYGLERKAAIGADAVFDFSLGNPSIPAPQAVKDSILELLELAPEELHGYTPAQGAPSVRAAIANSINRRFGMAATPNSIYMTVGAAASISISLNAVSEPGDEFIVIAPYFPEYRVWIETAGCTCVEVMACEESFQLDVAAIEAAITPRTAGIIVNSPNNPVGSVYAEENLRAFADMLRAKQAEVGRILYVISDEPYREIAYAGVEVPYIPSLYENTIVCYSYSKSLSLPGERIGYVYVSERMENAAEVYAAVCGAGRALGFVCAPVLFQRVVERCVDEPADVEAYARNRELLCTGLSELGYEYVEPQGAFYLWMKALAPDEQAFAERAKAHELLLVPSTSFGSKGYVRIGYCVDAGTIERSMSAFAALMQEYKSAE